MKLHVVIPTLATLLVVSACTPTRIDNVRGQPTAYEDPSSSAGRVQGVGIESQDIVGMTDQMMRDLLSNPTLAARSTPPRVVIDSEHIRNESSTAMNLNLFTSRLRASLNRAAEGRMAFVSREFAHVVEAEREMKRDGVVDGGTIRHTQATAGVDYRLVGSIASQDMLDRASGARSRYHQVSFEMLDMELGTIVWSGFYEIRKSGQDHVLYR